MNEYPVFVPVGNDAQVAAVVSLPDNDPIGVVVLTTGGGGVPRSHRYCLWTKVARRLADSGIASVRMEWPGVGDSTGVLNMDFKSLPVRETTDVARFAIEVAGVRRLGIAGNCGGARTALYLADSQLSCEALALLILKPLSRRSADGSASRRMLSMAVRFPSPIKALVRPIYWNLPGVGARGNPLMSVLERVSRNTDVLLLEPLTRSAGKLPDIARKHRRNGVRTLELKPLPGPTMSDFDSMEDQEYIIGTVVDWFERSFAKPVELSSATTRS